MSPNQAVRNHVVPYVMLMPRGRVSPFSSCSSARTGSGEVEEKGEGERRCSGGVEEEEQGVDCEGGGGLVVDAEEQEVADSRPRSP